MQINGHVTSDDFYNKTQFHLKAYSGHLRENHSHG